MSESDAGKRIFDANRPLKAAGVPALDALRTVAELMREIVAEPTVKGTVSAALTEQVGEPYLRFCRPCNAIHLYEMPFRLAALQGGLVSILADDLPVLLATPPDDSVRLLGPFDPYLQLRDRELLVADPDRRGALWPALGRPGAITVGGEVVGLWRPRAAGKKFTIEITPWIELTARLRDDIDGQAEALAAHRGVTLVGVVEEG
ncbi:DNA glycosylase AlkZ-like family protein [Rhodococcus daqingensis]|uniref:DNA glycosylase AlkZ-like family protein n=1 Tax=Rhodococcus daqingensis TaxID=2479363 RepID=A0ABW2RXH9_9NOCA